MNTNHRHIPPIGVHLKQDVANRHGRFRARARWSDPVSRGRRSNTHEWAESLARPRRPAGNVRCADVPERPGVYAWFRNGECVYLGKASDLRSRLGTHLGTSLDLSRSTLRSWVAVRKLELSREHTRRRPAVMTGDRVAVINAWIRGCDLAWMTFD